MAHKWYVFLCCIHYGLAWRGIIHDLSKFYPDEFMPYARHFFTAAGEKRGVRSKTGYYKPTDTGDAEFDRAWFLHQKRNDHHWQWWTLPEDQTGLKILSMTKEARLEMVADWHGAHLAQKTSGSVRDWYLENGFKMQLHPETREWVESVL